MKSSILNAIPIDIVEIVIVKSKNYNLFLRLQDLLDKLKEQSRVSRINDKLTETFITDEKICYILNGKLHREYNKPSQIHINDGDHNYYVYDQLHNNYGCPSTIFSMERFWRKHNIQHREEDLPRHICYDGEHEWCLNGERKRINNLPTYVSRYGARLIRGYHQIIFCYLD